MNDEKLPPMRPIDTGLGPWQSHKIPAVKWHLYYLAAVIGMLLLPYSILMAILAWIVVPASLLWLVGLFLFDD